MRKLTMDLGDLPRNLRDNDAYLHLIADALPALIAYVDRDHRYRFVNQAFETWFGRSSDELIGMRVSDLVGPHAYKTIGQYAERALAGERCAYEVWMPYADKRRYVSASYVPDVQPSGDIPGFFVLVTDMTARKEAEISVHQEREFTQAILDSVESEICILDDDGTILFANEPWHRFWVKNGGDNRVDWNGVNYFDACVMEPLSETDNAPIQGIKDVLSGAQQHYTVEYPCHSPDEQRWFRLTATPLSGMRNMPGARAVVVHAPITEQRLAVDAMRAANSALADSIQDLAASQTALQRELDLKNRFFSILAHDLKSPFTTILGASGSLAKKADVLGRDSIAVYSRNINTAMNRVHGLLEQLLEWGRIQSGALPLQKGRVDLGDTMASCIALVQPHAKAKDIAIDQRLDAQWADVDINALRTVLRNLLTNAIKFSESGDTVTVCSVCDGETVKVSVIDSGVGLAQDIAADVFRIDRKTTLPGTAGERGSGLGLPLCRDLVERSGGRIWVDAPEGGGAAFHFTLPTGTDTP